MIISASTEVGPRRGPGDGWPLEVIEIMNAGRPAWLIQPVPLECNAITFDFAQAGVFSTDPWLWAWGAKATWNQLRCGYPEWQCRIVALTEEYRAEHARHAVPRLGHTDTQAVDGSPPDLASAGVCDLVQVAGRASGSRKNLF